MSVEIGVGRPSGEQNNDTNNQRTHDIRVLTIRTHVFNLPSGSPCATPQEVQDDVDVLRERMEQATISVAWDGVIHALPLPADGSLNNGLTVSAFPFQLFNSGEQHIVDANVIDAVLDVFYIEGVVHPGDRPICASFCPRAAERIICESFHEQLSCAGTRLCVIIVA